MAVKLAYNKVEQFSDGTGIPYPGAKLFTYVGGSVNTKQTTYTESTGTTPNTNPIVLDSAGRLPQPIWLTTGVTYKFVLAPSTDTDPPTSPVWTLDRIAGINDTTLTNDQWVAGPAPTFASTTSFILAGDQTSAFHAGRRLKTTNSGGTVYSTIISSVFAAVTTVTVSNDSGSLDSGLSAVSYGLLTATNPSQPRGLISAAQITSNQNNYTIAGLSGAMTLRLSSDARRSVTGLAGGAEGLRLSIHNVGTFPIVFKYEDTNSTAANRFAFAMTLGGGQTMAIEYDSTTARWRASARPEPLGTIKDFGTSTMPEDFLAIDQNVSRTTYASLFNEIGTSFGAGDGALTFGLFVGAGAALLAAGTGTQTDTGANADVDTATDAFTVPSNDEKWTTGMAVVFTLASGTITGLASGNTYYIVRNSATTVKLSSSLANAQNGSVVDLTAKSSPVWTLTHTYTARTHGQRLGKESKAMTSTEHLAHIHSGSVLTTAIAGGGTGLTQSSESTSVNITIASTGGNAAMPIMNPHTVVTRGIRYC